MPHTNRALIKRDPTQIPRDPSPARPAYQVVATCYLIGDPRPFLTMIGAPGLGCSRWSEQARLLADYFDVDRDDIAAPEGSWKGADGEDDTVDLITVAGRIVGSFGMMISAADVAAIVVDDALRREKCEL